MRENTQLVFLFYNIFQCWNFNISIDLYNKKMICTILYTIPIFVINCRLEIRLMLE